MKEPDYLSQLPQEILLIIFNYLDLHSIFELRKTGKKIKEKADTLNVKYLIDPDKATRLFSNKPAAYTYKNFRRYPGIRKNTVPFFRSANSVQISNLLPEEQVETDQFNNFLPEQEFPQQYIEFIKNGIIYYLENNDFSEDELNLFETYVKKLIFYILNASQLAPILQNDKLFFKVLRILHTGIKFFVFEGKKNIDGRTNTFFHKFKSFLVKFCDLNFLSDVLTDDQIFTKATLALHQMQLLDKKDETVEKLQPLTFAIDHLSFLFDNQLFQSESPLPKQNVAEGLLHVLNHTLFKQNLVKQEIKDELFRAAAELVQKPETLQFHLDGVILGHMLELYLLCIYFGVSKKLDEIVTNFQIYGSIELFAIIFSQFHPLLDAYLNTNLSFNIAKQMVTLLLQTDLSEESLQKLIFVAQNSPNNINNLLDELIKCEYQESFSTTMSQIDQLFQEYFNKTKQENPRGSSDEPEQSLDEKTEYSSDKDEDKGFSI